MLNTKYEVISTVKELINTAIIYYPFSFGNVRRLDMNNKSIYLWQNAKGEVHYSFSLFDKETYTTSATKLGNVLSSYFQCPIEVVNNEKEQMKKLHTATASLKKDIIDSEQQSYYSNFQQPAQLQLANGSTNLDIMFDDLSSAPQLYSTTPQPEQQNPLHNQEDLQKSVIQLSTYYLESSLNTTYIKINEIPIVYKNMYEPSMRQVIFTNDEYLNCKNSFTPTQYMVKPLNYCDPAQSFILSFLFFMASNDRTQVLKILAWISDMFSSLGKLPFALVLYSKDDTYMQLFYDEIVVPLFNIDECEKIESDSLDKKSLADKLDQNFICNFHNITTPIILGEPACELTNRLIHKDKYKLNNKVVTTVANILITSTTSYIPLISDDVPTATVNVSSKIDDLCNEYNIRSNKHSIAKLIKNDLDNFVSIIRCVDLSKLCNTYQVIDDKTNELYTNLLDSNTDVAEVFNMSIKNKDITLFKMLETKAPKLYNVLIDDFDKGRVNRKNLIEYFSVQFGTGTYKSNRALIADLKDLSSAKEPFDNIMTFNNNGNVYYRL